MGSLQLVTWNVAGLDESRLDERSEAQCFAVLLSQPRPDVIALQEIVDRSWRAHWKSHLRHAGYRVIPEDPRTDSEYFSLLAVHRDWNVSASGSEALVGSRMGRRLLWAALSGEDRFFVCTGHLDSGREGQSERLAQLSDIARRLSEAEGAAIFAGDTNLRAEEEPLVQGLSALTDAWLAAGSPNPLRATWRSGPIGSRGGASGRARARFDRIYLNARTELLSLSSIEGAMPLSDHIPLRAQIRPLTPPR